VSSIPTRNAAAIVWLASVDSARITLTHGGRTAATIVGMSTCGRSGSTTRCRSCRLTGCRNSPVTNSFVPRSGESQACRVWGSSNDSGQQYDSSADVAAHVCSGCRLPLSHAATATAMGSWAALLVLWIPVDSRRRTLSRVRSGTCRCVPATPEDADPDLRRLASVHWRIVFGRALYPADRTETSARLCLTDRLFGACSAHRWESQRKRSDSRCNQWPRSGPWRCTDATT
jgi:hypothetical protein